MNVMQVAAIFRRVITITAISLLISGCVTRYSSEPQNEESFSADIMAGPPNFSLDVVKKRMSACLMQYAIAKNKNDNLHVDFFAAEERVVYQSSDPELAIYMSICAGEEYTGNDEDKGSVSTFSKKE